MKRNLLPLLVGCTLMACGSTSTQSPLSSPEPRPVAPSKDADPIAESKPEPTPIAQVTPEETSPELAPKPEPDATSLDQPDAPAQVAPPSDVPAANLHVNSITTNGVTLENVVCRTAGGGLGSLLGTMVIGKPFVDRKSRLDRCVTNPQKTRVRWSASGGKMTNVEVISANDPANQCIAKSLEGATAIVDGECAASLEIGK